jgi:hypothetical protein
MAALVLPHDEHKATRTYDSKGRKTKAADKCRAFKDIFIDDIKDVRSIAGDKYDDGIMKLVELYVSKGKLKPGEITRSMVEALK